MFFCPPTPKYMYSSLAIHWAFSNYRKTTKSDTSLIPASCMHSTWSLQPAFLHHSRLLDLLDSHAPSNPHFEGELQDLWGKKPTLDYDISKDDYM